MYLAKSPFPPYHYSSHLQVINFNRIYPESPEGGSEDHLYMSNFKPKDNPSRVFIPEIICNKFSSEERKLIIQYNKKIPPKTWSPSSGNTRTLPNAPRVPDCGKSRSISCHQGQEGRAHAPDIPPNEETSGQDQQLLAMAHETINAPVNHPSLILTKFCPSTESTQEHL